jgi:hypothetical protein
MYPNYCYPSQKQGKKRKVAASAISATPKGKKVKVLTHRHRRSETATVPTPAKGSSSTAEPDHPATAEAIVGLAEEPIPKTAVGQPKTLSLLKAELSKIQKTTLITPKRRRMASVLDAVMESTEVLTLASTEVPSMGEKNTKETVEVVVTRVEAEAGSWVPAEIWHAELVEKDAEQGPSDAARALLPLGKETTNKEYEFPAAEASTEGLEFIMRHAAGKKLSEEQVAEARQYAKDLKYPPESLVYNGTDEDDFLYYLPDSKEISVCREIAENIGFPKIELGLSAMSKGDLADSLAYNSLKVRMF